jgi:phage shock protein A
MDLKLIDRMVRLLKADAHGVVESLEERSLLLKQYVREAEIALNEKRARLEALREEERQMREALVRRDKELAGLEDDIGQALANERDDLARFAIRRLLPRQNEATIWRNQIVQRAAECQTLAERVDAQQEQLDNLRMQLRTARTRDRVLSSEPDWWVAESVVADEEVEIELLRRRRGREGVA